MMYTSFINCQVTRSNMHIRVCVLYIHVNIQICISGAMIITNIPLSYEGYIFCYYLPPILLKLRPLIRVLNSWF